MKLSLLVLFLFNIQLFSYADEIGLSESPKQKYTWDEKWRFGPLNSTSLGDICDLVRDTKYYLDNKPHMLQPFVDYMNKTKPGYKSIALSTLYRCYGTGPDVYNRALKSPLVNLMAFKNLYKIDRSDPYFVKKVPIESPLHHVSETESFKFLLNSGADVDSLYGKALIHRSLGIDKIKLLIQYGADVSIQDEYGNSALHYHSDFEVIKLLVKNNANINLKNKKGKPPLHIQASNGNFKAVSYLLEQGADISVKNNYGSETIHQAIYSQGTYKLSETNLLIDLLVSYGANINAYDNKGNTPLHYAVTGDQIYVKIVNNLIRHGANVNAWNRKGDTPLLNIEFTYSGVAFGAGAVIKSLVENGADVNISNGAGVTPIRKYARYPGIVKFLKANGAQ